MPESLPPWPRPRTRPVLGCCSGWQWPRWWPTAMRSRRRGWPRATRPRGHLCVWPDAAGRLLGIPGGLGLCGRQDGIVCGDGVDGRLLCVARASCAVAVAVVVALTAVNYAGIQKSAWLTRSIVAVVLVVLTAVVVAAYGSGAADPARLDIGVDAHVWGMLQAAGLLFFAFAGYARIATLGRRSATRPARSHAPSRWRWASPWRCMPWSPWP